MAELTEVRTGRAVDAHDRDRVRGPGARDRGGARARPRLASERELPARAQGARRVRRAALRGHRRRHELGQVPHRRARARTARGARSSTAPRSRGSARASTRPAGSTPSRSSGRSTAIAAWPRRRGATASRRSPRSARPGCGSRANSADFVDAVRARCGVEVEVISGEEEARLAYLAATAGLESADGSLVVFDTGGGSSQFTFGHGRPGRRAVQRRRRRGALHRAVRPRRRRLRETLAAALDAIAADLARLDGRPAPDALVGMGGAVTNLAAVKHGLATYDPDVVQGTVLDRAEIDRQIELYRTRDRRRAPRDRRPAAQARRGHPRRRLHRAHRARQARQRVAHRQRPRPAARRARRALRSARVTQTGEPPQRVTPLIPIVGWLPRYERRWLRGDVVAGIAVTALIVPKNLGYAEIAGVPVQNGLYAAAAGAIIYALFCTSRQISTGPSSALATVAGGAVIVTGLAGGMRQQLVAAITLVTGCCSCFWRSSSWDGSPSSSRRRWSPGSWPAPRSTWSSASCQADRHLGRGRQRLAGVRVVDRSLGAIHLPTLVVGLVALAVILALRFWAPKVPGALVLVVGGLLASAAARPRRARRGAGRRRAERAARRPSCRASTSCAERGQIVIAALALLLIGFSQTAGDARSFATRHHYRIDATRSRSPRGWPTSAPVSFQGMPVSTSLSASSLNESAGARTPWRRSPREGW